MTKGNGSRFHHAASASDFIASFPRPAEVCKVYAGGGAAPTQNGSFGLEILLATKGGRVNVSTRPLLLCRELIMSVPSHPPRPDRAAGEAPGPRLMAPAAIEPSQSPTPGTPSVARGRRDKTMIGGYFTPDLSRAVKLLAVERGITVQGLIGEALDDVLIKHGKPSMGER